MHQVRRTAVAMSMASILAFSDPVRAIDHEAAVHAATVASEMHPGDDIQHDYRPIHVQVADIDRDGTDEIVYLSTATCVGANFDCENDVKVMTALKDDDPRTRPNRFDGDYMTDLRRRARQSGYADDASLHIPGEIRRLVVEAGRIHVAFDVKRDSPICKRTTDQPHHCPEPGHYVWLLAWREGNVSIVREVSPDPG